LKALLTYVVLIVEIVLISAASRAAPEAGGGPPQRDHGEAIPPGRGAGQQPGPQPRQRPAPARPREAQGGGAGEVAPPPGAHRAQRAPRAGAPGPEGAGGDGGEGAADAAQPAEALRPGPAVQGEEVRRGGGERGRGRESRAEAEDFLPGKQSGSADQGTVKYGIHQYAKETIELQSMKLIACF